MIFKIPALIKILCLFASIVGLYRLKAPLWAALLFAAFMTGLWFEAGLVSTLRYMAVSSAAGETFFLCAVIFLLLGLSNIMEKTGTLERIVSSLRELLGSSMYSGAVLPALIGLLPMPGGAVFSAPMVEAACSGGNQTPEQKAAVNYWFRHVWEYWWPLYPGVILASFLFKAPFGKVFLYNFPLTVFSIAGGYFFILKPSFNREERRSVKCEGKNRFLLFKTALRESLSIIVVIAAIFGVGPLLAAAGVSGISAKYWPVIIGVVIAVIWLSATQKLTIRRAVSMMVTKNQFSMIMLGLGIMVFKGMIDSINAFSEIRQELFDYHVPILAVIIVIPFLAGFVVGLAVGFVGISMPIVISLLTTSIMGGEARFAYLELAYCAGYMGMMLSPVHLCLILTKDYFKADFVGVYKAIALPALMVVIAGTALFIFYQVVL